MPMSGHLSHDLGELDPVHVGHGNVGQHRRDIVSNFEHGKRLDAVVRLDHVIAGFLEDVGRGHPHQQLILCDEDDDGFGPV
jgi:hypothetical protein